MFGIALLAGTLLLLIIIPGTTSSTFQMYNYEGRLTSMRPICQDAKMEHYYGAFLKKNLNIAFYINSGDLKKESWWTTAMATKNS